MNNSQQQRFNVLYEQHLINLRLQGKQPATIDTYSRVIRQISAYFDNATDKLTLDWSLNGNLVISYLTIADVQSTPCSVVKRATKVAHNGIVVTANMMTDCRFLAAIDIVRNASNARLLIGLSANNQSYCPCITLWSRLLCPMNSGC